MSWHHFINLEATTEYLAALHAGENPEPFELVVELYLSESMHTVKVEGNQQLLLVRTLADSNYARPSIERISSMNTKHMLEILMS